MKTLIVERKGYYNSIGYPMRFPSQKNYFIEDLGMHLYLSKDKSYAIAKDTKLNLIPADQFRFKVIDES